MKLETKRLVLRDLEDKDVKRLPELVNDLDVSRYLSVVPYPYRVKEAKWFIKHSKEKSKNKPRDDYTFGIILKETNELVGCIGLSDVNDWNKKAELGYWLAKKYWGQGIMFEAVQRMLKFTFSELRLERLDINADVKNVASNKLIKKIGATFEGTARKNVRAKSTGKYGDSNRYGLLKENWRKKK